MGSGCAISLQEKMFLLTTIMERDVEIYVCKSTSNRNEVYNYSALNGHLINHKTTNTKHLTQISLL